MDEILELQKELMEIQLSEPKYRLSERNCVDIMLKVIQNSGIELYGTLSGLREYVTPEQLRQEIIYQIDNSNGRFEFDELEEILNVDKLYIKNICIDLINDNNNYSLLDQNTVISDKYIKYLSNKIGNIVIEYGIINISTLSTLLDISITYLNGLLNEKLKHNKSFYFKNENIYSDLFFKQQKSKLKGLLSGSTYPIKIDGFAKQFGFDANMFNDIINKVTHELNGSLNKDFYTPKIFYFYQKTIINDFYNSNLYHDINRAQSLYVPNMSSLQEILVDSIPLSTLVIHPQLHTNFLSSIEEYSLDNDYIDIYSLLPSAFTNSDVDHLMKQCKNVKREYSTNYESYIFIYSHNYLFPSSFLYHYYDIFEKFLPQLIEEKLKKSEEIKSKQSKKQKDSTNKRKLPLLQKFELFDHIKSIEHKITDESILNLIIDLLFHEVENKYNKLVSEITMKKEEDGFINESKYIKEFHKEFTSIYNEIMIYYKSNEYIKNNRLLNDIYHPQYINCLLFSYVRPFIVSILKYVMHLHNINIDINFDETQKVRQFVENKLEGDCRSFFLKLFDYIKNKKIDAILSEINNNSNIFELMVPKTMNKNDIKTYIFHHKMKTLNELNNKLPHLAISSMILQIIVVNIHKILIPVVEKEDYLQSLLEVMKHEIPADIYNYINQIINGSIDAYELVIEYIKSKDATNRGA